jgi:hypothetical protein
MGVCLLIAEAKHGPVSGLAAFHQLEHLCTTSARNRTNPMPPVVSAIGTLHKNRTPLNDSAKTSRRSVVGRSLSLIDHRDLGSQSCRVDL